MSYDLEFCGLTKEFRTGGMILGTKIKAVDDISLKIPGDKPWITSIVGESGSGKTTLAKMVLGLLDPTSGEVLLNGEPIKTLRKDKKAFLHTVQPVFQNPFTAFSGRRKVESYLAETVHRLHLAKSREQTRALIEQTLNSVGLDYAHVKGKYPNQFSGGELQRVSVARALLPRPRFILADEPVAMIDASLRMNIVNLFKQLKLDFNVSFIYITHDLSTANYVSDYIGTMYRGNLIEFGESDQVMQNPSHPYTELLLDALPRVGQKWDENMAMPDMEGKEYQAKGCRFAARCPYVMDVCRAQEPPLLTLGNGQKVKCFRYSKEVEAEGLVLPSTVAKVKLAAEAGKVPVGTSPIATPADVVHEDPGELLPEMEMPSDATVFPVKKDEDLI